MSDVFDLPLQRAVNELAIVDKNDCVVGWADAFSGEVARDCIVESINNHDRLIEENKQQRESLDAFRELVKAQTKTMSELNEENLALQQENAELKDKTMKLTTTMYQLRDYLSDIEYDLDQADSRFTLKDEIALIDKSLTIDHKE